MEHIDFQNVKDIFYSKNGEWTITTLLGHILGTAEAKYGNRDHSYTILGIELYDGTNPDFWFPGNCKNVVIRITNDCREDINKAVFQVAHESIHLLNPKVLGCTTYLEEGLATYFSKEYLYLEANCNMLINEAKYRTAYDLVKYLLSIDGSIIRKLRMRQPNISLITEEILLNENPNIPSSIAKKVTTNFQIEL